MKRYSGALEPAKSFQNLTQVPNIRFLCTFHWPRVPRNSLMHILWARREWYSGAHCIQLTHILSLQGPQNVITVRIAVAEVPRTLLWCIFCRPNVRHLGLAGTVLKWQPLTRSLFGRIEKNSVSKKLEFDDRCCRADYNNPKCPQPFFGEHFVATKSPEC